MISSCLRCKGSRADVSWLVRPKVCVASGLKMRPACPIHPTPEFSSLSFWMLQTKLEKLPFLWP